MVNKNNIIVIPTGEESGSSKIAAITSDKGDPATTSLEEEKAGDASASGEYVENPKILALISSLTALMLQVKQLAEGEK